MRMHGESCNIIFGIVTAELIKKRKGIYIIYFFIGNNRYREILNSLMFLPKFIFIFIQAEYLIKISSFRPGFFGF